MVCGEQMHADFLFLKTSGVILVDYKVILMMWCTTAGGYYSMSETISETLLFDIDRLKKLV